MSFGYEQYLDMNLSFNEAKKLAQFRSSSHQFNMETGRHGIWVVGKLSDAPLVHLSCPSRAPLVPLLCPSRAPLVHLSCPSRAPLVHLWRQCPRVPTVSQPCPNRVKMKNTVSPLVPTNAPLLPLSCPSRAPLVPLSCTSRAPLVPLSCTSCAPLVPLYPCPNRVLSVSK